MRVSAFGLWLLVSCILIAPGAAADPPRPVNPRLVLERIAAEPEIVTPTGIAVDHRGRILVIESHTHFPPKDYKGPRADRIRVFEDRDHDGRPEPAGIFLEGTKWTMNLAVARDRTVFVATRAAIYRLEDRDDNGRADGTDGGKIPAPIVRLDTRGDYPHNGLSGFAFDAQDNVYFGLGENLGAEYRLVGRDGTTFTGGGEGGNIYRCRPDGTKLERIATGFWNPFHMTFDANGHLFVVNNDPDSRPPCRLLHIVEGGDYGYRFRNGRRGLHPFTAWNGELPGTLGMVAGTGKAPSGVVAYESDNLPADYHGAMLVTSWGDHRIERYDLQPHGDVLPRHDETGRRGRRRFSAGRDRRRDRRFPLHQRLGQQVLHAARQGADLEVASESRRRVEPDARGRHGPLDRATPSSDSPLARADAMRGLADPAARDVLLKGLESDDPFLQQAARQGLKRSLNSTELARIAGSADLSPARRLGLLLILRDQDGPEGRHSAPVPCRCGPFDPLCGDPVDRRASSGGVPSALARRAKRALGDPRDLPGHARGAGDARRTLA